MLFAAIVPAQTGDATAALARAKVLEAQEGDLKAAEQAYRALLSEKDAAVQQEAALRLGSLLWKLDQKDAGKPFLEQAVAMGGEFGAQATAVLQGQSEAALQEQEQLVKARAMLDRITELWYSQRDGNGALDTGTQQSLGEAVRDLKWNGKVAAQTITEALGNFVNTPSREALELARNKFPDTQLLLQMLWEIGTPPAEALLRRSATSSSVFWRRYVTKNITKVAPDLVPVFVQFLHDPDPIGEVQRNLQPHLGCIPLEGLEGLILDPDNNAKVAGIEGLAAAWQRMSPEQQSATFARIHEPLRRALSANDSRQSQKAYSLLRPFSAFGPNEARELVLEFLGAATSASAILNQGMAARFVLDDRGLSLLLAAARNLGPNPPGPNAEPGNGREAIGLILSEHQPAWTSAGVIDLLTLLESGYSSQRNQDPRWVTRIVALATPEQLGRLLRATPQMASVNLVLNQLSSIDETKLPKDTFEAARDVIEQCLKLPPAGWQELRQPPGTEMRGLLNLVARSGSAAAPEWLTTLATRFPSIANDAVNTLIQLSSNGVGEPASNALRKFLVWEGSPEAGLHPNQRSMVFAELSRLGDAPSIALFPRAYKLGLGNTTPSRPPQGPRNGPMYRSSSRGIGFLALEQTPNGAPREPLFGYTDPQLVLAWRTLLQSDAREEVWSEIATLRNRIPGAVLPLLAAELPTEVANLPPGLLDIVLSAFGRVTAEQAAAGTELHAAIQALLRDQNGILASSLFTQLQPEVLRQFAGEARALLRGSQSPGAFVHAFERAGIKMEVADWQICLQDPNASFRAYALNRLPQPLPTELRTRVEEVVRTDPDESVRSSACNLFGRMLSKDAVPPLLDALRDNAEPVRKAATEALERIRFFQEQQAYWQNAKAGIDTSPANATAKLLAQAKPGEPKDQRLLALRSLAVLGSPESLPYLIDWTKDPDAEVAAAALEAVTTIHRTSAKK
jgi:hypothetical protein